MGIMTATGRRFYPQTVKNYLQRRRLAAHMQSHDRVCANHDVRTTAIRKSRRSEI
ncbi:hypothetical protein [Bradyrhizobium elkanii]